MQPARLEHSDVEKIVGQFVKVASFAGLSIAPKEIQIELLTAPHKPPSKLPNEKFAVYAFFHGQNCLKIGKAGAKSQARYISQHYGVSAPSTLAKSIFLEREHLGLGELLKEDTGLWIKDNLDRLNIVLPMNIGIEGLNLLEAFLQCYFKPKYEGFKSQRKVS